MEQEKLCGRGVPVLCGAGCGHDFDKVLIKGRKVVCLVSGGNIDVNMLSPRRHRGLIRKRTPVCRHHRPQRQSGDLAHVSKVVGRS